MVLPDLHALRGLAPEVLPEVKATLIDTGKVRYVYRDFPLDQVALTAAMVARALPPARYEAFVCTLLASQDRWAFARDVNSDGGAVQARGLGRHAAPGVRRHGRRHRPAHRDPERAAGGVDKYNVDSTPTFIVNEKPYAGEQPTTTSPSSWPPRS